MRAPSLVHRRRDVVSGVPLKSAIVPLWGFTAYDPLTSLQIPPPNTVTRRVRNSSYGNMLVTCSGVLTSQISSLHFPQKEYLKEKLDDLNEEIRGWRGGLAQLIT